MSSPLDEYQLDMRAVRRGFDRASKTYARAAVVQAEIRARLLERLDLVKLQPMRTLDLGAASGQSSRALKDRYPKSQVFALDLSTGMLAEAAREQRFLRRFERIATDAQRLPLRDGAIDLAFSNLMLAWCNNPDAVFREKRREDDIRRTGRGMSRFVWSDLMRGRVHQTMAKLREDLRQSHRLYVRSPLAS